MTDTTTGQEPKRGLLETLVERLEKATGPSRELDCDIFHALDRCRKQTDGTCEDYLAPQYTQSIDAALMLVPEGWHVVDMGMPNPSMKMKMAVAIVGLNDQSDDDGDMPHGIHLTSLPIALCIASLKSRLTP